MNTRRAANRRASQKTTDHSMHYASGEEHTAMHGRKIPHREPDHHEDGYAGRHEAHASFGSPASVGASKGAGPLPGAGELEAQGPGPAARGYKGIADAPNGPTPSGAPPKGMSIYRQE